MWFLGGALCGILGFLGAAVSNPSPSPAKLVGKSADYVLCYSEAYRSASKKKNMMYACAGWTVVAAIFLATYDWDSVE